MIIASLLLALPLVLPSIAQVGDDAPILDAKDAEHRAARIAVTGDLGMAPLPPLTADSPLDSLVYADRRPVGDGVDNSTKQGGPELIDGLIPPGPGGTGTFLSEIFRYQLPVGYDPEGPELPLIVAYHGFGSSVNSVDDSTTLDEEANARNWIYVAPTGIDDKLFGSPICQQHVEVVIQWMLDNFQVDADRIYMVGFSMGGGVAANFSSRRRDPDGIMIAALGCVSGAFDWTQTWTLADGMLQDWLENNFNFEGNPAQKAFNYKQASGLFFDPFSYPPLPGDIIELNSMTVNLEHMPTYLTYDVDDPLNEIPDTVEALDALLISLGATTLKTVQSGTIDPDTLLPAPHSWAVLDETEMYDFFEGKTVERHPESFSAMQDLGGNLSWASTIQRQSQEFTYITGVSDPIGGTLTISDVTNAVSVEVDAGLAGISGIWPVRVTASSADDLGFTLRLTGFDQEPSYLLDATTGELITLVNSDPTTGTLIVHVPATTALDVNVVSNPDWTGKLFSFPSPTTLDQITGVSVNMPAASESAWLIVAAVEQLYVVKGVTLTALAAPPGLVLPLVLDFDGNAGFNTLVPNDPLLLGLRLPCQVVGLDNTATPNSVSNLWAFEIE
jgi:acetyl esterase/lipase